MRNVSHLTVSCDICLYSAGIALAALHSRAVDYMKTGVHAELPAALRPKKWPHFMEKRHKPKDQIYVSKKVLGQLYDQVERVDFAPEFEAPFDERILSAYDLSEDILAEALDVKATYDAAMHRVMAQHEIGTEFEVWSTFVLEHANQSKDFKFHEEMGAISVALKDRFRTFCYEKAGGRDLDKMGPFVAAMYQVTKDQVVEALQKRRKAMLAGKLQKGVPNPKQPMPLMSFPWLFAGILGKIANGEITRMQRHREQSRFPLPEQTRKVTPKKRAFSLAVDEEEDVLKTAEGIVHRGELLKLFDHDEEDPGSGDGSTSDPVMPDGISITELPVPQNGSFLTSNKLITEHQEAGLVAAGTAEEIRETDTSRRDAWTDLGGFEELVRTANGVKAPKSDDAEDIIGMRKSKSITSQADSDAIPMADDALIDLGFGKESGNERQTVELSALHSDGSLAKSLLDLPVLESIAVKVADARLYPGSLNSTMLFDVALGDEIAPNGATPLLNVDMELVYEGRQSAADGAKKADRGSGLALNGEEAENEGGWCQERPCSYAEAEEKDEVFAEVDGQPSLLERLTLLAEV